MIKDFLTKVLLIPIKFYRKFISPAKPACCKYYPTCSTYAVTALKRFGPIKGSWLAIKRIVRCNPWSLGGIDHVPDDYHYFQFMHKNKEKQ